MITASETIGIGVIGAGLNAQIHAAGWAQLARESASRDSTSIAQRRSGDPAVRAVAVADPSGASHDQMALTLDFPNRYETAAELLADPQVHAVWICTPTSTHAALVDQVLCAGKHLYCEKPLAPTFDVVREICARAKNAPGLVTQVGFQYRTYPINRRLAEIIHSGELGRPMGYTLRDDQYFPSSEFVPGLSDWRASKATAGGGALLEHSIHAVDLLAWMFGRPARVFARTRSVFGHEIEDTAALTIEHADGTIGNLVTVFHGVTGREERRLEVFFERGVVEATTDSLVGAAEESFLIQRPGCEPEHIEPATLLGDALEADGLKGRTFPFYQYLSDRTFLRAVAGLAPPGPGFDDALIAHATVEAAYRSAVSGTMIELVPDLLDAN